MAERERDIRKFERAAERRLAAASLLLENAFHLEAMYIAGYSAECALKALILKRTSRTQHAWMWEQLTHVGAKGHDIEYLRRILVRRPINCVIPRDIGRALRNLGDWTTNWRYEVIQIEYNDARRFLRMVDQVHQWTRRS
ncbi:MAG TPA: HEPN domain-containing protein [Gemmataceae bacterium]|nr:HEPN domain-containing protein [Gemmataceae bacterium]